MEKYAAIGVMSGTSLDGVDMAYCEFTARKQTWQYRLKEAITYDYPSSWKKRLSDAYGSPARALAETDKDLGLLMGEVLRLFIKEYKLKPDFIATHGHTIFHDPTSFYTVQIGSAPHIAARTNLPVVGDFRTTDVAKGGQGAPLVPAGDKLLFAGYDFCLNLGGFANISFDDAYGVRRAYDIAPCNMALNEVAAREGLTMDAYGKKARSGTIDFTLLEKLNALDFYWKTSAKSLGKEWYDNYFAPLIKGDAPANDILATITEHIAQQIAKVVSRHPKKNMLITGGGAYNSYLVERIDASIPEKVIIPGKEIIEFKEALVFGFLGVLRMREEINTYCSVTGATTDTSSGTIYLP
jgi:anhydro-N-acetylmuramic acid kinase